MTRPEQSKPVPGDAPPHWYRIAEVLEGDRRGLRMAPRDGRGAGLAAPVVVVVRRRAVVVPGSVVVAGEVAGVVAVRAAGASLGCAAAAAAAAFARSAACSLSSAASRASRARAAAAARACCAASRAWMTAISDWIDERSRFRFASIAPMLARSASSCARVALRARSVFCRPHRCGEEPVLRLSRGGRDVMRVRGNLTRVLHRVDHIRELRAAHEQLDQVGALALVDRDEQSRCAALCDQALLLGERELGAVRGQLLLRGRELDLRAVPGVHDRAEPPVERVHLCQHLRGLARPSPAPLPKAAPTSLPRPG